MKIVDADTQKIWDYFEAISNIPRPSKKEEKIVDYIVSFAEKHNLKYKKDKAGNVLIFKSASKGLENKPPIMLQSHVDMVCEKTSESKHNFETDPIEIRQDGDWVKANKTTLGADNGIGVSMQLAILESNELKHGPLACLFTVDEETGLTGAKALNPDFFETKMLINLDSEDDKEICIGCAGGIDTVARFKIKNQETSKKQIALKITIDKLMGGHSGDEIHKGRANSIILMSRLLKTLLNDYKTGLCCIEGGKVRNAIPSYAACVITVSQKKVDSVKKAVVEFNSIVKNEFHNTDPNIIITVSETSLPKKVLSPKFQRKVLDSIYICPNGVISWSQDIHNLVETSSNLATILTNDKEIVIGTSQRSSVETAKKDISNKIKTVFKLAGGKVTFSDGYPGWNPNPKSVLVQKAANVYEKIFTSEPVIIAIHAGLECGLFLDKNPELDMISIGPLMKDVHTPIEKLSISSTKRVWKWLTVLLEEV